jgi:Z1 domain
VSGYVWAILAFIAGLGVAVLGDMVSEEVRDRLDHIPHAILKLAARRLDAGQRSALYADEWLPELTYILTGAETRPITRLFTGTHYALGILASAHRTARHLHRSAPAQPALLPSTSLSSKAEVAQQFWSRYRWYLQHAKKMPAQAVAQLDEATSQVIGMLEDPGRDGTWRRGGLVVAPAQSGRTGNYIGLACKAADAGYKLIVVLTDNHNLMRLQTQIRVDEGFLGFDTQYPLRKRNVQKQFYIGAGGIPGAPRLPVISLTTSNENGDFKRRVASVMNGHIWDYPVVLVIKKNLHILEQVRQWIVDLEGRPAADGGMIVRSFPVLIIDAQAGNPSVNIAALDKDTRQSRINAGIRHLLESFDKCAYVGYTATPSTRSCLQLGVGDDKYGGEVFPRDFIVSLKVPSTYFGPERVFGCLRNGPGEGSPESLPMVRFVTDYDGWMPDSHKKSWTPPSQLPGSLSQAISAFVLACAARRARGHVADHKSMLIHATRFQDVQNRVADQVSQHLQTLKAQIRCGATTEQDFRRLWERDFIRSGVASPLTWGQVWPQVQPAIEKIQVQAVNGTATSPLQYHEHRQQGLAIIAVGGNTLPPGLNLEGLTVSYYLQASTISGTLLQMSRSFGYRPGYEDLCRLYATPALLDAWVETFSGSVAGQTST